MSAWFLLVWFLLVVSNLRNNCQCNEVAGQDRSMKPLWNENVDSTMKKDKKERNINLKISFQVGNEKYDHSRRKNFMSTNDKIQSWNFNPEKYKVTIIEPSKARFFSRNSNNFNLNHLNTNNKISDRTTFEKNIESMLTTITPSLKVKETSHEVVNSLVTNQAFVSEPLSKIIMRKPRENLLHAHKNGARMMSKSKKSINKNKSDPYTSEMANVRDSENEPQPNHQHEYIDQVSNNGERDQSTSSNNTKSFFSREYNPAHYFNHPTNFIDAFTAMGPSEKTGCNIIKNACCANKNNTCWSFGPRKNNPLATVCYCDEACNPLGDCCTDYEKICLPVDCVLADEWEEWSKCDAACGIGVRQRKRRIVVHPENFGKPCGNTLQKSVCEGSNCKDVRSQASISKETAMILPATYAIHRSSEAYNPLRDLRKNIYLRNSPDEADDLHRPSLCMTFEIVDIRQGCESTQVDEKEFSWTNVLRNGTEVCVECQSTAMVKKLGNRCRGQGVIGTATRWSAFTKPGCQGKWILKEKANVCQCEKNEMDSFVLV